MRRVVCVVEYKGTGYNGWQRQKNTGSTFQEILERTLSRITGDSVAIEASSRTDAGVHAVGQVVAFSVPSQLSLSVLKRALNACLPREIRIRNLLEAPQDFHPRRGVKYKHYVYLLALAHSIPPFWNDFVFCVRKRVFDLALLQEAANSLVGYHDFTSFSAAGGDDQFCWRTIFSFRVEEKSKGLLRFDVVGDGFLYKMVRIMVGEIWRVGTGEKSLAALQEMLNKPSRVYHRFCMPPQGLYLVEVGYEAFNPYQGLVLREGLAPFPLWVEEH